MVNRYFAPVTALAVLLAANGCGKSSADATDAGPDAGIVLADAALADAGPMGVGTCEAPLTLAGVEGTVTIEADTTDAPAGVLELGAACGGPGAGDRPPQSVVAYVVPGTGPVGIRFSTATGETLTNFDTLVEVRRSCGMAPAVDFPPSCFNDVSFEDVRADGSLLAEGGETLYFVVTGVTESMAEDAIDRGPFTLEVAAEPNTAPTLTGGVVRTIGERTEVLASGTDADENLLGISITFLDGDGAAVDLDGDRAPDPDLLNAFDAAPVAADYDAVSTLGFIRYGDGAIALSDRLVGLGVSAATLVVFDDYFAKSEPLTIDVAHLEEVGLDATCDEGHGCTLGLICQAAVCVAHPTIAALCATSTTLPIATPTTETVSEVRTGVIAGGFGTIEGSCAHSPGAEVLFDVTVPEGDFDLLATTDLDGTGATDTVLYIRSACPDRLSELANGCNDDISERPANIRSQLEFQGLSAGTYTIFVETFGHPSEVEVPYSLEVALRPVLTTGATCDPTGAHNRCALGACPSDTPVCP